MHPSKLIEPARVARSRLTCALRADLLGGRGLAHAAQAKGKFTASAPAEGGNGAVSNARFGVAGCAQGKVKAARFAPAARASGKIM